VLRLIGEKRETNTGRMTKMASVLYQARAGDGFRKKGLKRANSFFSTAEDAVSEVLALKEKMDLTYKNEIQWDYSGEITGNPEKMKILRGYLGGDRETNAFFLQIFSVEQEGEINTVSPVMPKKLSPKDKKVISKVKKFLK
jgi:hypothetical protein